MQHELNTDWIRYIFTSMDDAVCMTEKNGEVIYANPSAEKLFGLEFRDGMKIWEAIPYVEGNDELIQLFIDGVLEKKKSIRSLVDYVNNEGKVFNLHVSLTCETGESEAFLIVISDLTDLKKVHSAFERYTSPEIAKYVLATPEGGKQGGEARDVTILMSDLRGFTALSTQLSSAELIVVLNHYFASMSEIIARCKGTVIEFLGDGIFVVFGAPADVPDHAEAAVRCAIDMQNAMEEVNQWNRKMNYPVLEMGIGINSGTAVVGNIGSENKMKYGCMGETVNLAGRTETLTVGGQVLITERTAKRITEKLEIAGERSFIPKGIDHEIKIYSVSGIGLDHFLWKTDESVNRVKIPANGDIGFHILREKTVEPELYKGQLLQLSEDEKNGLLATETPLVPMMNLMFRIGSHDIYAKIQEKTEEGYKLRFTPKSVSILELLQ